MKIIIAGGTGLIGQRLIEQLTGADHEVVILTRQHALQTSTGPDAVRHVAWDARSMGPWVSELEGSHAIVNLTGANIGRGRWTDARKKVLLNSRVESTQAIVEALGKTQDKPSVLVNASAVGFYGDVPEEECREDRSPGTDFLAQICVEWEKAARPAEQFGVRVVMPRSGVVLDPHDGALPRFLLPFRMFVGGSLGSGKQWFPWIHPKDEVDALIHVIHSDSLTGPLNLVSPGSVRMKDFTGTLGSVLKRPSWAPVPGVILKIALGEMAGPLVLSGQRAVPDKLIRSGFRFSFSDVRDALEDLLQPR